MGAARRLRVVDRHWPGYADPAEVAAAAETMDPKVLECRANGHQKKPWAVVQEPDGGFTRTLRCPRCKRVKWIQQVTPSGRVVTSRMKYDDGYLLKGMGRIAGDGRDALRLAEIWNEIGRLGARVKGA